MLMPLAYKSLFAIFSGNAGRPPRVPSPARNAAKIECGAPAPRSQENRRGLQEVGLFHGATRRTIQRPSNDRGGCAAGENDRREALRFPALRVR
jgi:hypothetical protein